MAYQHYHDHNGTLIPDNTPSGPSLSTIGYALLPLLLSILFFIFFLVSGKLIL